MYRQLFNDTLLNCQKYMLEDSQDERNCYDLILLEFLIKIVQHCLVLFNRHLYLLQTIQLFSHRKYALFRVQSHDLLVFRTVKFINLILEKILQAEFLIKNFMILITFIVLTSQIACQYFAVGTDFFYEFVLISEFHEVTST